MKINLLILILLTILNINCSSTKNAKSINKIENKTKRNYGTEVSEVDSKYMETRKIKYLYKEDNTLYAFFDNGKASKCEDCGLCKGNIDELYLRPAEYDYRIEETFDILVFSKKEDKNDVGLKLSSRNWIIKNFINDNIQIKDCDE